MLTCFFYCISLYFNDLAFIRACYQSINSVIKVSLMWSVIMSVLSDQVINSVIIVLLMWPLIISAISDQVINSVIKVSLI